MKIGNIITEIVREIERAEKKFPTFPLDPIHAAAVIAEESGELVQASLQYVYEGGDLPKMRGEAVQTAAMCFRFLNVLDKMEIFTPTQIKTEVTKHND